MPDFKDMLKVEIPHLEAMVRDNQPPFNFYTLETYMEFHSVLVATVLGFRESLGELRKCEQSSLEKCIFNVVWFGMALHAIAYGSAIEPHLHTISRYLSHNYDKHIASYVKRTATDREKASAGEEAAGEEDSDFQGVQPYTIVDTRQLLPWETMRDWLKLIIAPFEALFAVSQHINTHHDPASFSVSILAVPAQVSKVLPWKDLLKKRYKPLEGQPSVEELISTVEDLQLDDPNNPDIAKWFKRTFGKDSYLSKGSGFIGTLHSEACLTSLIWLAEQLKTKYECGEVSHTVVFPCHIVLKLYIYRFR
jgi:hypothetical protein